MHITGVIALASLHQPACAGILYCLGGTAIYHIGGLLQNNGGNPGLVDGLAFGGRSPLYSTPSFGKRILKFAENLT